MDLDERIQLLEQTVSIAEQEARGTDTSICLMQALPQSAFLDERILDLELRSRDQWTQWAHFRDLLADERALSLRV